MFNMEDFIKVNTEAADIIAEKFGEDLISFAEISGNVFDVDSEALFLFAWAVLSYLFAEGRIIIKEVKKDGKKE